MKQSIIISACLLGRECRYNGSHSKISTLASLDVEFIPVCPEEAGKLGTPRPAAELETSAKEVVKGIGKIITKSGVDVTAQFLEGSKKELLFLTAYLSFADRERIFSLISLMSATSGFLETDLNKLDLFSFIGKYLEGFFFKFE